MKSLPKNILMVIVVLAYQQTYAQSYFVETYPKVWARSAKYTLEVAQAMPDSLYHYQPQEDLFSFHGQLVHIADNLAFLSEKVTGQKPDYFSGKNKGELTKAELIDCLQKALQHVQELLPQLDTKLLQEEIVFGGQTMPKENILYLMRDHMAHHRGQAILYLRANGITPPRYVGW